MGFFFRKSKSFGSFRVNASRSGLGISGGLKGLRVSLNRRGATLFAGRSGLYYRQKLSSGERSGEESHSGNAVAALFSLGLIVGLLAIFAVIFIIELQH